MSIINDSNTLDPFNVPGLLDDQRICIESFLQGAVYCWCNIKKCEWFAARNLIGGDNQDWSGTPLNALYSKHIANGKSTEIAFKTAGKEVGRILRKVLKEDDRDFECRQGHVNEYKWRN